MPRAYEVKGAYKGQNEANRPSKNLLCKYLKLPRAYKNLNLVLTEALARGPECIAEKIRYSCFSTVLDIYVNNEMGMKNEE